jgi:hypothetical protein
MHFVSIVNAAEVVNVNNLVNFESYPRIIGRPFYPISRIIGRPFTNNWTTESA